MAKCNREGSSAPRNEHGRPHSQVLESCAGLSILNREVSKCGERMVANAEHKVWSDLRRVYLNDSFRKLKNKIK